MFILGICGSPREGGNADILLEKALEGARASGAETEKIILNRLKMVPCQECDEVRDDGTCKVEDDFQPLYEKVKKADGLILAAPIFFGSLSAQTKTMVDRFQCHWRYKYVLKKDVSKNEKSAALILVEASRRDSFLENAKSIVKNLFATINFTYKDELFCQGVDTKKAIQRYPDCLTKAFEIGKKLAGEKK